MAECSVCCCEEKHEGHICWLRIEGNTQKIKEITSNPKVSCFNCGEEVNSSDNVCSPVSLLI
jgi:hypothetical protein